MSYELISRQFQKAIFDHIATDDSLSNLLSRQQGARAALPRLEFDFLESKASDQPDICRHEFQFSLWSELHDTTQADRLADRLHQKFDHSELTISGANLILLAFESLIIRKDKAARYQLHQMRFKAVTQSQSR